MTDRIVGIDHASSPSETVIFGALVHWSYGDPIPRFLCRSHEVPQYEPINVLHNYDGFRHRLFAEMRYECGTRLFLTKTDAELEEVASGLWHQYQSAFIDPRMSLKPELRLAAIGALIIGAWESAAHLSPLPEVEALG